MQKTGFAEKINELLRASTALRPRHFMRGVARPRPRPIMIGDGQTGPPVTQIQNGQTEGGWSSIYYPRLTGSISSYRDQSSRLLAVYPKQEISFKRGAVFSLWPKGPPPRAEVVGHLRQY